MNRLPLMAAIAKKYLTERIDENGEQINEDYKQRHAEIQKETLDVFDQTLRAAALKQEETPEEAVHFLTISALQCGILQKTYDFQIAVHGKALYVEPALVYAYWSPRFIFQYIDDDMKFFEKKVRKYLIRVRDHEFDEFRRMHALVYIRLATAFFHTQIEHIVQLKSFQTLPKAEEFQILCGGYMDHLDIVYPAQTEEIK